MSADLPPPAPTPPSIEEAVQAHLDVVHELRELHRESAATATRLAELGRLVGSLAANQERLANEQTVDRLTLGRVEKKLDLLLKHLGVRDA